MKKTILFFILTLIPLISFAEEIIVDNSDSGFTIISGTWVNSTSVSGFVGVDYLHDGNVQSGNEAEWALSVSTPSASYEVYARWTSAANRSTSTTYTVNHSGGSTDVTVNQQIGGGTWISLGSFTNPTSVSVTNVGADGFVIVDAIRAVGGPDVTPPAPGPVNFGPAKGSDIWTAYSAQLGLYVPHSDICEGATEVFVEVGNSGLGICMDMDQRVGLTWENAREACAADGKRLPEVGEWKYACKNVAGLLNMTDNYEWASSASTIMNGTNGITRQGVAVPIIGLGGCNNAGWGWVARVVPSAVEDTVAFRCVR